MNKLSPSIQELISTPVRKEIFNTVNLLKGDFTFIQLYQALEKRQVTVSVTSVQNLLKALNYRGYLREYTIKENKSPGRSTIYYRKLTNA